MKNVRILRAALERITPTSVSYAKLDVERREGFGRWNGFITDDGYYIHARTYFEGGAGDIGHSVLRDDYLSVCGEERAKALLKIHAQRLSEVVFFGDEPVLTTAQVETFIQIVLVTDEPLWFRFQYDLHHRDNEIPF